MGLYTNGVVDENFLELYGIQLKEGRKFQANSPGDKRSALLSSTAAKRSGFSSAKECIGTRIILPTYNTRDVEIIGVYDDYEFEPYFAQVQQKGHGSILTYKNSLAPDLAFSKISFKINLKDAASVITRLEELYKSTFSQDTFQWTFLWTRILTGTMLKSRL